MLQRLLLLILLVMPLNVLAEGLSSQTILSLKSAKLQIEQAEKDHKAGKLNEVKNRMIHLRPLLSETTELHSQLYAALKDDSKATATADQERLMTIEFAKLRDRANYLAGLVSKEQGYYLEAVKHFVLVVQSQRTTGLGKMAFNELRAMGFSPYLSLRDQI